MPRIALIRSLALGLALFSGASPSIGLAQGESGSLTSDTDKILPAASASLLAAPEAPIGLTIPVDWRLTGAAPQPSDMIVVARPEDPAKVYAARTYARNHPADLRLPLTPGEWELRFLVQPEAGDPIILGRQPLRLVPRHVTLAAPASIGAGSRFLAGHDGPAYHADYISVAPLGSEVETYAAYNYVARGGPVSIVAPLEPGDYELRYISTDASGDHVLGTRTLTVEPVLTRLQAPDTALAGSTIEIDWTGPDNGRDFIALAQPGSSVEEHETYVLTSAGSPARLILPVKPGDWELRYIASGDDYVALASRPLTITPVSASIDAPARAPQRSVLLLPYEGPGYPGDYLALARPGARPEDALVYAFVSQGNPARIRLPAQPGPYELRYIANNDPDVVLYARSLEVSAVETSLEAPPVAGAGAVIDVTWVGPGAAGDVIAVAEKGMPPDKSLTHVDLRGNNPVKLRLPSRPGTYDLRYVAGGKEPLVLWTGKIEVIPVSARIEAEASFAVGQPISLYWEGPTAPGDRIAIARPEDAADQVLRAIRLKDQPRVTLAAPTEPGAYELRYLSAGEILARKGFVTTEAATEVWPLPGKNSVEAQHRPGAEEVPEFQQGSLVWLGWKGPGNPDDRLTLAPIDAGPEVALSHAYLRDGNPVSLRLPLEPGSYEIRYTLPGVPAPRILVRLPILVTAVSTSISAPGEGVAGSTLAVDWTGPGNPGDRLTIARPEADLGEAASLTYLNKPRPEPRLESAPPERLGRADLALPIEAGDYELRYIGRGVPDQILARQPIRVLPVSAGISAEDSAPAGAVISVGWSGPAYRGDYLELTDQTGKAVLSRPLVAGNPLQLALPPEAGAYLLRYRAGQDGSVLAERPLHLRPGAE